MEPAQINAISAISSATQLLVSQSSNTNKQFNIGYDGTNDVGRIIAIHQGIAFKNIQLTSTGGVAGGSVGIGKTNPSDKLDVDGNIRTNGNINLFAPSGTTRSIIGKHATASSEGEIIIYEAGTGNFIQNIKLNTSTASHGRFRFLTRETERMTITNTGNVGIGTTNPIAGLDIEKSSNITFDGAYFAYTSGGQLGVNAGTQTIAYGLRVVERSMFRSEINVFSDKRIKTNILDLSDNECLKKLRLLKPCKYEYIDKVSKGSSRVYGFIAQEVEEVIPYSVDNTRHEIIPDYYNIVEISTIDISFIEFDLSDNIQYDLSLNQKIRVIIDYSANIDDTEHLYKQYDTEVIDIQGKTIKIKNETNSIYIHKIFLYGKKVNDFCVLNKSAIWTVATAALQEIDRIQQKHQTEIQDLQTKYDLLLKRLEALENNK
jgi:hypothetical protein